MSMLMTPVTTKKPESKSNQSFIIYRATNLTKFCANFIDDYKTGKVLSEAE